MGTKEIGLYFSRAKKNRILDYSREGSLRRDMSVVLLGFWLVWLVWAGWCWVVARIILMANMWLL